VAASKLRGWRQALVFGVVGCLALGAVVVVGGAAVLWWAVRAADQRGAPELVATSRTVPLTPVASIVAGGAAPAGQRLVIELQDGLFDIVAGEPGGDVRIDGELASNYYELVEEREGTGGDGPVTAIRLRPTTSSLIRGLTMFRQGGARAEMNRLTVAIPPDRPLALVLNVSLGRSRIDLGGLTLTDLYAEMSMGTHALGFGVPLGAPLPRLEIRSRMGDVELARLGNARASSVEVSSRMGEFIVDLDGVWTGAAVSDVAMEHSMGDLRVQVPTSVRLADDSRASARFAEPFQIPHDGETADPDAPVVRLDIATSMGGTRVGRVTELADGEIDARATAIPAPAR